MDYFLATDDVVGISFWIATAVMAAGALFFFVERSTVKASWQTSLTVAALVCFVAFWHYMYMRDVWVATMESPTVYRYIDWLITVPMQIVEFYLILAACTAVSLGVFWKLLAGSLVMLLGGYAGETGALDPMWGFVIGMAGWIFILYEIFAGEASKVSADSAPESVQTAFNTMRWIVTIGWAIYPLGYYLGVGAVGSAELLNVAYNIADIINKIQLVLLE